MSDREQLAARFVSLLAEDRVRTDEPMREHTTFRIGGPADFFLLPETEEEVLAVLDFCKEKGLPRTVIGNGSNLLVSDAGYRGAVIAIDRNMSEIRVEGNRVIAQAGALLAQLATAAREAGLTGLEFAGGIPGSVGGAVAMNAGAYGGEICDTLERIRAIDAEGTLRDVPAKELALSYRTSRVKEEGWIVLEATFALEEGDREEIAARMEELKAARAEKQPLNLPSAGSTFKRPPGNFAGKLIMEAGLAGFAVGGAAVSEKHCGFVVNQGGATADDVYRLIREVTARVRAASGITLEPEVRFLGEFEDVY